MATGEIEHNKMPAVGWAFLLPFIVCCFTLCGCCGHFDIATKKNDEDAGAWLTRSWSGPYNWRQLGAWRSVADAKVPQADLLLRDTALLQITWEQAGDLTGQASFPVIKGIPFLLRGVGDARGRFPLELFVRANSEVWVGGGANSKCPVAKLRKPAVAWLDKAPSKVYVTFEVNSD
jgi:hypothetical protein